MYSGESMMHVVKQDNDKRRKRAVTRPPMPELAKVRAQVNADLIASGLESEAEREKWFKTYWERLVKG